MKKRSIETAAVHAGNSQENIGGAVILPIFQTATYRYQGEGSYDELKYVRLNNTPNHNAVERKLAVLEGGEAAVITASGMAAITDSLLTFLSSGDHLLAQDCIYGGTMDLLTRELPRLGIEVDFLPDLSRDILEKKIRKNTRALFVESITNPLMEIGKLLEASGFARSRGILAMIDNTFASPCNFRPIEAGFDLVLHSCTKYLNGHSDLAAGVVVGRGDLIEKVKHRHLLFGATLDPHACFLLERGLKTLPLRIRQHNQNGEALASFLSRHPGVDRVHYPGLPGAGSDPASRALFAGFGGMLSIELAGGGSDVEKFLRRLEIPINAPSLGGVESLISRPSLTSHSGLSAKQRGSMGISDNLIRISAGIEGTDDLIEDFRQALE